MRKIGIPEIEDIALGAALLGAGGVNSMLPIAAAARLGLPLVDCDGMGRAFPELQMVTFTIGGGSAPPWQWWMKKEIPAFSARSPTSGRKAAGNHPRPDLSRGYRNIHASSHGRAEIREAGYGGGPQVLPSVADGEGP